MHIHFPDGRHHLHTLMHAKPSTRRRTGVRPRLAFALLFLVGAGCLGLDQGPPTQSPGQPSSELEDESWPMLRGGPAHLGARSMPSEGVVQAEWAHLTPAEVLGETVSLSVWKDKLLVRVELGTQGGHEGAVLALDLSTGQLVWEERGIHSGETGAGLKRREAIVDSGILLETKDAPPGEDPSLDPRYRFVALDAQTGSEAWSFPLPAVMVESRSPLGDGYNNYSVNLRSYTPAVRDGLVYFGTSGPIGYALDQASGQVVWDNRISRDDGNQTNQPAVVAGDFVYLAGGAVDARLFKLHRETGKIAWEFHRWQGSSFLPPAIQDGTVYVVSNSLYQQLQAVDSSGNFLWGYHVPGVIPHSPVVGSGKVYVYGWDNAVHALDATTGELKWRFVTGNATNCGERSFCTRDSPAPALLDDVLFVAGLDGMVYGLDAKDGAVVWSHALPGSTWTSPVVVGDFVYVGADETVHAIRWR